MALVKGNLDYEDLQKVNDSGQSRQWLLDKLRTEVDLFYGKGSVTDLIKKLNDKNDEAKKTLSVLETITLETKSDSELLELLKHREELMRSHALQLLHKKVLSEPSDRFFNDLRNNVHALVRTLTTTELESLYMTLDLFNSILDDDFKHKFRDAGGMRPLVKLLITPEFLIDVNFLIKLLQTIFQIVTVDENKENFRSVNGLLALYPLLTHTLDSIVILTSEILTILADLDGNRVFISKSHGTIRQIFKNAKDKEYNKRLSSLRLLHNIAQCVPGRDSIGFEDLRNIIGSLEDKKIYHFESSSELQNSITITKVILDFLFEVASDEKKQRDMGQLNIFQALEDFFLPLKNDKVRWEFEVLVRVLQLIDKIVHQVQNLSLYVEARGITDIVAICRSPANFSEEVIIEASTIITTVATRVKMNQQAYGKLGVQILLMLFKHFPQNEEIHELVSQMIHSATVTGLNNEMLIKEGCEKILIKLIRDSKVENVLKFSCMGLAEISSMEGSLSYLDPPSEIKPYVIKTVMQARVIPNLISLLQLGWSEVNSSVARILAAVADLGEVGLNEIVKNGGIVPLVKLLGDKDREVKEQALYTFGKILFGAGQYADAYIQYFFEERGEVPLLECILSKEVEVQVPALSILNNLTFQSENIEILRESGIEEKMKKLEKHPNVTKPGSQVSGFISLINKHLKQEKVNQRRLRSKQQAAAKEEKKMPVFWLKINYEHFCKMIPVRTTLTWEEFEDMIKSEFGLLQFTEVSMRNKDTEAAKISDQRSLSYAIDCVTKDFEVEFYIKSPAPIVSDVVTAQTNKLDSLLQRLTHKQLRILVKDAIDQGIDIADSIKLYISLNRRAIKAEDKFLCVPFGRGPSLLSNNVTQEKKVRRRQGKDGATKSVSSGGPPPAPPPPPKLQPPKSKITPGISKPKIQRDSNLITEMENKLNRKDKGLNRTKLEDNELLKRGIDLQQKDEVDFGSELWRYNLKEYIDKLVVLLLSNYDLMHIIFNVIYSKEIDFSDALDTFSDANKMEKSTLASAMLECGFTVESTVYTKSNTPTREYTTIICPIDLPSTVVLKLIRSLLHTNGGNRLGGSITEKDFSLTENPNMVIKGYWAKQGSASSTTPKTITPSYRPPTNTSKVLPPTTVPKNNAPVVKWTSRKVKPTIDVAEGGSLFDNDDGQTNW